MRNPLRAIREWWAGLFAPKLYLRAELRAIYIPVKGQMRDLGVVARKMVTTVGVKFLCDEFAGGAQRIGDFKWHEMGTDATAESTADISLQVPVETRTSGSQASAFASPNATYRTTAVITATAPRVIREHGLFSASSGGTLWDRSVFGAITLANVGDSVFFDYTLTCVAGG